MKKKLKFFTGFFCPYAQMAWISLLEKESIKQIADIEFIEGLKIVEGTYEVHPELLKLGRQGVPTIQIENKIVDGSSNCVKYIDETFEPTKQLIPEENKQAIWEVEKFIHEEFTEHYYRMLLKQDKQIQENEKKQYLKCVKSLTSNCQLPYFLGKQFSLIDVSIAPYMARELVLYHYRNFQVPQSNEYQKWHKWKENILSRNSVKQTLQDSNKIIEAYRRYAENFVRNNWYYRVNCEK